LTGCLICICSDSIRAQDWPQWRGPNRDSKLVGFVAPAQWPSELTKKWSVNVGLGEASPALVGDKVYAFGRIGAEEVVQCLAAKDGGVIWQDKQTTEFRSSGGDNGHQGPRSSPAVAEGKVCTLGVNGVLSCYDANDGKVLWRKDPKAFPRFHAAMSPVIVNGHCIAHLGGPGRGEIAAYDLVTGEEKWKLPGEGPSYSSPVMATIGEVPQLVVITENSLVGVALSDGKELWKTPFLPGGGRAGGERAGGGGRRGGGGGANNLMATPVVDKDTVYCFSRNRSFAVKIEKKGDAFAVTDVWTKMQPGSNYTTPVLKDGLLYGANSAGAFFCLKADTGEQAWSESTRRGDPAAILDAGKILLALTSNGDLTIVEPSGEAYKEVAKIKVASTPVWSYPIIAGNRVIVKDEQNLTLLAIE
jgi:outer membrane protein assembly factor BamB